MSQCNNGQGQGVPGLSTPEGGGGSIEPQARPPPSLQKVSIDGTPKNQPRNSGVSMERGGGGQLGGRGGGEQDVFEERRGGGKNHGLYHSSSGGGGGFNKGPENLGAGLGKSFN